jgi:hypothetical protein
VISDNNEWVLDRIEALLNDDDRWSVVPTESEVAIAAALRLTGRTVNFRRDLDDDRCDSYEAAHRADQAGEPV